MTHLYRYCSFREINELLTKKVIHPSYRKATGFSFYTSKNIPNIAKLVHNHAILVTYNLNPLEKQGAYLIRYEEDWIKKNRNVIKNFNNFERQRVIKKENLLSQPLEEWFLPICLKFTPKVISNIQIYSEIRNKKLAKFQLDKLFEVFEQLKQQKAEGQNIYYV
jgi:hypothetical protein